MKIIHIYQRFLVVSLWILQPLRIQGPNNRTAISQVPHQRALYTAQNLHIVKRYVDEKLLVMKQIQILILS